MKYAEKNAHYRDIHLFIIKAKEMTIIKDAQLIQDNLWLNFKNVAQE